MKTEKAIGAGGIDESLLRLVLEATRVGIWDWNIQTGEAVFDERWAEIAGYRLTELQPLSIQTWQGLVHPDDLVKSNTLLEQHFAGLLPFYECECRIRHKDGRWVWILDRGQVVEWSDDRKPRRMIGTHADISERKRSEEKENQAKRNFETLFNSVEDFLFVLDGEGTIRHANWTVVKRLGYPIEWLKGKSVLLVHPEDRRAEAAGIVADMLSGTREYCPIPLLCKNGDLIAVETRVTPGEWDGQPAIFGVSKDVSALKLSEQKFASAFENSQALMAISEAQTGRFIDVNEEFLKATGYRRDEVIGRTSLDLGLIPGQGERERLFRLFRKQGCLKGEEVQIRKKTGQIIHGLFSAARIQTRGEPCWLTVMVDLTDRYEADQRLNRLSQIQGELMRLATSFVNVSLGKKDEAINNALERIGSLIQADRCYVFRYDFQSGHMSNTHEWCAEEITPEIDNLQLVPMDLFPEWVHSHRQGETVHIPAVASLPVGGALRDVLEPQDIQSLITLPIICDETCFGFVGFDAVKECRNWQAEEVQLLRVLAELFANLESRQAAEIALSALNAEQRSLITKLRALQASLILARDEAEAGARAKAMFLANMSHEIRTPLNAVLGYTQIMTRDCGDCPTGSKALLNIRKGGEHLLELLNDILELAQIDAKGVVLAPSEFDFYSLLESIHAISVPSQQPSLLPVFNIHSDVPRHILADKGKIRQVIVNLISNALKFTEDGSVTVCVGAAQEDAVWCVTVDVVDSGCGIAADNHTRIFDPFEQVNDARLHNKGTGLGLSLSRRFAQALGGDVSLIFSAPGRGSHFRFSFAVKPVLGWEQNGQVTSAGWKGAVRLAPGQKAPLVLVVDDNAPNLNMLAQMLREAGLRVETAGGGEAVLQRWRTGNRYDLILLDKRMPGLDGLQTLEQLRRLPDGDRVPVVLVTASGLLREKHTVLSKGANGYLLKPLDQNKLFAEIQRLTQIRFVTEPSSPEPKGVPPLRREDVRNLPTDIRVSLLNGLRQGNVARMREVIEQIQQINSDIASGLSSLVDQYDYDRLYALADMKETGESLN